MKENFKTTEGYPIRLGYYFLGAVALWSVLIGLSLTWILEIEKSGTLETARIEARTAFEKDVIYRRWNAEHGGVYAPVTNVTPPNLYLSVPEHDITTPLGKKLTKINPAYMTRQIHELALKTNGIRGHITSLNLIRPANAPDPWETRALKAFHKGVKEISSIEKIDGNEHMRLMRPLLTEKDCLKCHAEQGYKLGDIRGGISVSIPMAPLMAITQSHNFALFIGHGLIWLAGLAGIGFGFHRLKQQISKRLEVEEVLLDSEEKFRLISEQSLMAIVIIQENSVKYANQAYSTMTGYPMEEIIRWTLDDISKLIHTDDLPFVVEQGQKKAAGIKEGVIPHYAYRGFKKSGEMRWVDQYSKTIMYRRKPADLITLIDINDQKLAQETLIRSEKRYRDLADSLPQIVFEANEKGTLTFVNRNAFDLFGYSQQDFDMGINAIDLLIPEDRNRATEAIQKLMNCESLTANEYTALRKDGATFPISIHSNTLFHKNKAMGFRSIMIDLTQARKAAEALGESEEKYRLLIENATDAIYIAQDGILKFVNPKAETMSGYSAKELANIPFIDLIHPEDRDIVLERHRKRLKGEDFQHIYSFRILNKSGQELSVEINAVQIRWEGKPATINFMRNITELHRLENRLQQARKMEAIGTLAGGVAHDFNNLLMAIQGRISLLLIGKDYSHPDFEHLRETESHIGSAANLTKQLLGFARGGKYEVRTIDLNSLFRKSSAMFMRTKREIAFNTKFQKGVWRVEADKGQIEQVLMNLFVNAWQAMPGGGDLQLNTENVILNEKYVEPFSVEPGRYVKISVTDTGVGMDKATQEKIFDPFFTTKEMGRGIGLGLASVYGILKNHGGFIDVYSERGKGTAFNAYLPASEKEIIEDNIAQGDTLRGFETVLLVDDQDIVTEVTESLLSMLGYQVFIAGSGKEAINIFEQNQELIDVVILDMTMPGISGGDTYDRLKEMNPDLKVLLSSGYSIDGQATEILNRGCNGFIQKPFRIDKLSQKLREILDGD